MKITRYPNRAEWSQLLIRPAIDTKFLERTVENIINDVKIHGDEALRHCSRQFDGVEIDVFEVSLNEIENAEREISSELKKAINLAKLNIERFHEAQIETPKTIETSPGVFCWRKSLAIEKVGIYAPGGTAPLFSTVLMLAIPAKIAGCKEVILCTPPDRTGKISDAILYTAKLCGVTKVFKIGGAQAIAALAFGTESVPKVFKIFGPGNQFVTEAKLQITKSGIAIDMPAGPSEVAIFADSSAIPAFVAADLLAQAEHGTDSQVLLICKGEQLLESVLAEIEKQLPVLPRAEIAVKALENSHAILVENPETALELLNEYAPEHLILATEDAESLAEKVINAGSVFLGNLSCEAAGDYASGTNHSLPTNGFAKSFSGVSVDSFVKKITFQKISELGIESIGKAVEIMADAEGLFAHKNSMTLRIKEVD